MTLFPVLISFSLFLWLRIDVISSCPERCSCSQEREVYCTERSPKLWTMIPLSLPQGTSKLAIHYQDIQIIRRGDFEGLEGLLSLEIYLSQLQRIEDGAFRNLSQLNTLFLASNDIVGINERTFMGLESLIDLRIQQNQRLIMPFCALSWPISFQILNISNTLTPFHPWLFIAPLCSDPDNQRAFGKLRVLGTVGNGVNGYYLTTLSRLQELTIQNPPLFLLQEYNISHLKSLETLSLSELLFFPSEFLQGGERLNMITLSDSPFTHLPAYAFGGTPRLLTCLIRDTLLTYIHSDSFRGLSRLMRVEILRNNIHTLPDGLFLGSTHLLNHLDLTGNPLVCNCSLSWFFDVVKDLAVTYGACQSPSGVAGVPLEQITFDNITSCEPGSDDQTQGAMVNTLYIALSICGLVICIFIGCVVCCGLWWVRLVRKNIDLEGTIGSPPRNDEKTIEMTTPAPGNCNAGFYISETPNNGPHYAREVIVEAESRERNDGREVEREVALVNQFVPNNGEGKDIDCDGPYYATTNA